MKSKMKYFILLIVGFLVTVSCEDKDKQLFSDFQRGSIPIFAQGDEDSGFIDLVNSAQSKLSFSLTTQGLADVSSVDVAVAYNNSETGVTNEIVYTNVSSFPSDIDITFDELLAAFGPNIVTNDSLDLGDSFVVNGYMKMTDGRYLNGGYSPSVLTNQVFLTYNVACASDLAGTYDFELISGENGEVSSLANQTIEEVGAGYYEISDMSMDLFGPDFPIKFRFTDICGNLTADPASVDLGDQVSIKLNPGSSVDPDTGEITFKVEYIAPSCCGLPGIITEFKATPK